MDIHSLFRYFIAFSSSQSIRSSIRYVDVLRRRQINTSLLPKHYSDMGNLVADYVAVGGGLAGRVTASHLDQSGKDAIFLETGPDPSDDSAIEYFLGGLSFR